MGRCLQVLLRVAGHHHLHRGAVALAGATLAFRGLRGPHYGIEAAAGCRVIRFSFGVVAGQSECRNLVMTTRHTYSFEAVQYLAYGRKIKIQESWR